VGFDESASYLEARYLQLLGINLPDRPISLAMLLKFNRSALVAAMVKDFFDMTDISTFKDQPNLLELIDAIYLEIIKFGFVEEVCEARSKALHGPCAFNVFVKSNAVLNNWHLNDARRIVEERLRPDVELDVFQNMTRFGEKLSREAIQQNVAKQLLKRGAETFKNIETLRALSSEYVCLVLQEILRESNIRECRDDDKIPKRVSLLAVVALTLEQVLDLVDNSLRLSTWDDRSAVMSRHMALVLLSYLHPPSALSFPKASALNRCFGKSYESTAGVFFEERILVRTLQSIGTCDPSPSAAVYNRSRGSASNSAPWSGRLGCADAENEQRVFRHESQLQSGSWDCSDHPLLQPHGEFSGLGLC